MPRIIDVIEAPNQGPNDMVLRQPEVGSGDFRLGSQVIVRESQTAVFFRDGKALDTFDAGRHTISTANVPILSGLLGLATSGKNMFTAKVYFVNRRDFLDMKWGTPEPISLRDPDLGLARLRAFGSYSMAVSDPQLFVTKIVGTMGLYQTSEISNYLRGMIISKLTDVLGESKKGLFDMAGMVNEIHAAVRAKVTDDFKLLGIAIKQFFVESVSPTEESAAGHRQACGHGCGGRNLVHRVSDRHGYRRYRPGRGPGRWQWQSRGDRHEPGCGHGYGRGHGWRHGAGHAAGHGAQASASRPSRSGSCGGRPC